MESLLKKEEIKIEDMIYEIRGKQVILDRDLAKLYNTETRIINQSVKRNIERFPEIFCFQLNELEFQNWKSQNVISKEDRIGLRRAPYVFTEQGVAMLSALLKSDVAISMSIKIMDAFVAMRKYISSNLIEQKYINNQVLKNTEDIKLLQESFNKLESKEVKNEIYFNGQIYDAYSKIIDIMSKSKNELIVIDSYADKTFLDMIRKFDFKIILITKNKTKLTELDISKYNSEYHNLTIIYNDTFHDRYFIIDKDIIYHCGTSINHAGNKTFSINRLEDSLVKEALLEMTNELLSKS